MRISRKIGAHASKNYHFLTLEDRKKLAVSGLDEIKMLDLKMPDKKCFVIPDDEYHNNINFGGLRQVFEDFERYMDMK